MSFEEAVRKSNIVRHPDWDGGAWQRHDPDELVLISTKTNTVSGRPEGTMEGWEPNV